MARRGHAEPALVEQHNFIEAAGVIQIRVVEHFQNVLNQIHGLVVHLAVQVGQVKFLQAAVKAASQSAVLDIVFHGIRLIRH